MHTWIIKLYPLNKFWESEYQSNNVSTLLAEEVTVDGGGALAASSINSNIIDYHDGNTILLFYYYLRSLFGIIIEWCTSTCKSSRSMCEKEQKYNPYTKICETLMCVPCIRVCTIFFLHSTTINIIIVVVVVVIKCMEFAHFPGKIHPEMLQLSFKIPVTLQWL